MTEYTDISLPISPATLVHPGDPAVEIVSYATKEAGFVVTVSEFRLGSHTGTHLDAPAHFGLNDITVDRVPAAVLVGSAEVLDLRGIEQIDHLRCRQRGHEFRAFCSGLTTPGGFPAGPSLNIRFT